jgi:hypothetical protein
MTLEDQLRRRAASVRDATRRGLRPDVEEGPDRPAPARPGPPAARPDRPSDPGRPADPGGPATQIASGSERPSVRQRLGQLDLRNTWQVGAGAILVPLGVALIILAWYGAAHARYVQQQMPYLVSGSFVGLGCMVVGGLLFWAHWLYRIYDQADLHHQEQMQAQREMLDVLTDLMRDKAAAGNGSASRPVQTANGPVSSQSLVATPSGTFYHLPTCPVAQQRRERLRPVSDEEAMQMRPCRICDPPRPAQ